MSVYAYEITLDGGAWVGIPGADDPTALPVDLGTAPVLDAPKDRSSQNPQSGPFRPKNTVNTIVLQQDVSWINMHAFVDQLDDMVLLSDIQLQPPEASLPVSAYVAIVRPQQHPIVIASGDWGTVLDTLRDCTAAIPASWGLVVRMEDAGNNPVGGTVYFTAEQLDDTLEIAYAISNYLGGGTGTITVKDDGVDVSTNVDTLNFVGPGWTITPSGSGETVDIEKAGGGGGGTCVQETIPTVITGGSDTVLPTPLSSLPISAACVALYLNGVFAEQGVFYNLVGGGTFIEWLAGTPGVPPLDNNDTLVAKYLA